MPSDATYGYISSGLAMPKGGACYVAAFDNPANTSKGAHRCVYRLVRSSVFVRRTSRPEPLRDPDLVVYTCEDNVESAEANSENNDTTSPARLDVFLGDGSRRTVAEPGRERRKHQKAGFSYTAIDDSFPGKFGRKPIALS